MLDFTKILQIIQKYNSFLITTHLNPDADAIGSELALHDYLRILGKKVSVINADATPYTLEFLDRDRIIETYDNKKHREKINSFDVLFALDFNQLKRIGVMENVFRQSNALKICIDHHEEPENFTEYLFVDISYASTGEIIFDLLKSDNSFQLDLPIAEAIYAAIITDTGSFRFERTSPKTHLTAAELISAGVNPKTIYEKIYDQGSLNRLKLLASALKSINCNSDQSICYMRITLDDLRQNNCGEADLEGFVNYCLSVKGTKIGMLFQELEDTVKVSLRSSGNFPVNKIANQFNGGGHFNAAGIRIKGRNLDEAIEMILSAAQSYLNKEEE